MKTRSTVLLSFACVILLLGMALGCSQPGPEQASDEAKAAASSTTEARHALPHALPPNNPFLIQNSVYPATHFDAAQTDTTTLPVWQGDSTLEPSQVQWLPSLTTIGTADRPYSSGERAIFLASRRSQQQADACKTNSG